MDPREWVKGLSGPRPFILEKQRDSLGVGFCRMHRSLEGESLGVWRREVHCDRCLAGACLQTQA